MRVNIYFYPVKDSECVAHCHYMTCVKRCVSIFKSIFGLHKLIVLPGGSGLKTRESMQLRSGDLVIVYAGNWHDFKELIAIRELFETFRIILIVGEESLVDHAKCHLLKPRYITAIGQNIVELESVVNRMCNVTYQ